MRLVSRWVSLLLLIVLAGLQVKLWVSGGMRDVWRLEQALAQQESENAIQLSRNEQLSAEVSDLKEGAEAVEERARSELGMVKNDEVFYQVIEGAPISAANSVNAVADGSVEPSIQQLDDQSGAQLAQQFR